MEINSGENGDDNHEVENLLNFLVWNKFSSRLFKLLEGKSSEKRFYVRCFGTAVQ